MALNASIAKEQSAVASSGFYLSGTLGEVFFISLSTAGLEATVRKVLTRRFRDLVDRAEVFDLLIESFPLHSIYELIRLSRSYARSPLARKTYGNFLCAFLMLWSLHICRASTTLMVDISTQLYSQTMCVDR